MRHKFFDKKKIILAHFIGFFQFLSNNDEQVTNRKKEPEHVPPKVGHESFVPDFTPSHFYFSSPYFKGSNYGSCT